MGCPGLLQGRGKGELAVAPALAMGTPQPPHSAPRVPCAPAPLEPSRCSTPQTISYRWLWCGPGSGQVSQTDCGVEEILLIDQSLLQEGPSPPGWSSPSFQLLGNPGTSFRPGKQSPVVFPL